MKQVACGTHHTLALSENSEVFAWGAGEYGKLGIGDEEKHTSPVLVEELQGKGVRAVACGGFHSVALSDTGSVYCWGGGDKGQLGLGNDKSQTLPCLVDALQVYQTHSALIFVGFNQFCSFIEQDGGQR
jgi:hypothetical protein